MNWAQSQVHALYRPNKEVNLDTILKKWQALTDEEMSLAEFHGKYTKLIKEMKVIGQCTTEAKRYGMLRNNVKDPHLEYQPSRPEPRRTSIDTFATISHAIIRLNRKVLEVVGHQGTDTVPIA